MRELRVQTSTVSVALLQVRSTLFSSAWNTLKLTTPDTYKNCDWHFCDTCPSDKVLITRRTEVDLLINNNNHWECGNGVGHAPYNSFCCDPPSASRNRPVDPADLFEYPDEDHVMYYYDVEKTSNDDGKIISHSIELFCSSLMITQQPMIKAQIHLHLS